MLSSELSILLICLALFLNSIAFALSLLMLLFPDEIVSSRGKIFFGVRLRSITLVFVVTFVLLVVVRNGNPLVIMNGRSMFVDGGGRHNLVYMRNGLRLNPMSVSISFIIREVARVIR